jgi:hypothetical protein
MVLIWENLDCWRRVRPGLMVAAESAEASLSHVG